MNQKEKAIRFNQVYDLIDKLIEKHTSSWYVPTKDEIQSNIDIYALTEDILKECNIQVKQQKPIADNTLKK